MTALPLYFKIDEIDDFPVNFYHFGPKFLVDAQPQMFGSTFWRSSNTQILKNVRFAVDWSLSDVIRIVKSSKSAKSFEKKRVEKKCFSNLKERKIEKKETLSQMVIRATQGLSFPFGSRLFKRLFFKKLRFSVSS